MKFGLGRQYLTKEQNEYAERISNEAFGNLQEAKKSSKTASTKRSKVDKKARRRFDDTVLPKLDRVSDLTSNLQNNFSAVALLSVTLFGKRGDPEELDLSLPGDDGTSPPIEPFSGYDENFETYVPGSFSPDTPSLAPYATGYTPMYESPLEGPQYAVYSGGLTQQEITDNADISKMMKVLPQGYVKDSHGRKYYFNTSTVDFVKNSRHMCTAGPSYFYEQIGMHIRDKWYDGSINPRYAKPGVSLLPTAGFKLVAHGTLTDFRTNKSANAVSGYVPQIGDVAVMWYGVGKNKLSGHGTIWTGAPYGWVSDMRQNEYIIPYKNSTPRTTVPRADYSVQIYRHERFMKGVKVVSTTALPSPSYSQRSPMPSVSSYNGKAYVTAPTNLPPIKPSATELERAKYIATELMRSLRLTKEQVAGFLGNFYRESRFRPSAKNPSSAAGLAQWLGKRRKTYKRLRGVFPEQDTLEGQVWFVIHELTVGDMKSRLAYIKQASSIEQAADYVFGYYEFWGGPQSAIAEMNKYGQNGTRSFSEGRHFALQWYTKVFGSPPIPNGVSISQDLTYHSSSTTRTGSPFNHL